MKQGIMWRGYARDEGGVVTPEMMGRGDAGDKGGVVTPGMMGAW